MRSSASGSCDPPEPTRLDKRAIRYRRTAYDHKRAISRTDALDSDRVPASVRPGVAGERGSRRAGRPSVEVANRSPRGLGRAGRLRRCHRQQVRSACDPAASAAAGSPAAPSLTGCIDHGQDPRWHLPASPTAAAYGSGLRRLRTTGDLEGRREAQATDLRLAADRGLDSVAGRSRDLAGTGPGGSDEPRPLRERRARPARPNRLLSGRLPAHLERRRRRLRDRVSADNRAERAEPGRLGRSDIVATPGRHRGGPAHPVEADERPARGRAGS